MTGIFLTGCTSVYDLTTEESDLIAEYAAGILSKNSYGNKAQYMELKTYLSSSKLNSSISSDAAGSAVSPTEASDSVVEVIDPKDSDSTDNSQNANVSNMADVLGMENIEITCLGYDVTDVYPKDEFALSTSATEGHKLVVVHYNLINLSSEDVLLHVNENVAVKAVINGSTTVSLYATMLNDDIMNMDGKEILSGETVTGVFIFNVKEELCESIASLNVTANSR
jgi:hypothetical protein